MIAEPFRVVGFEPAQTPTGLETHWYTSGRAQVVGGGNVIGDDDDSTYASAWFQNTNTTVLDTDPSGSWDAITLEALADIPVGALIPIRFQRINGASFPLASEMLQLFLPSDPYALGFNPIYWYVGDAWDSDAISDGISPADGVAVAAGTIGRFQFPTWGYGNYRAAPTPWEEFHLIRIGPILDGTAPPLRLYPDHRKRLYPPTRSRGARPVGYL